MQREKCQIYSVTHLFFLALDYRDQGGLLYIYNSQKKIICKFTEERCKKKPQTQIFKIAVINVKSKVVNRFCFKFTEKSRKKKERENHLTHFRYQLNL